MKENYLYVCDHLNNRILVIDKMMTGTYQSEWGSKGTRKGQFTWGPYSIYGWEGIWYIGDTYSIQLFTKKGICLQRIERWKDEQFGKIRGICILNNYLCVSDWVHSRIRCFRK